MIVNIFQMQNRIATIDIGTNTVLLLIADQDARSQLHVLYEEEQSC